MGIHLPSKRYILSVALLTVVALAGCKKNKTQPDAGDEFIGAHTKQTPTTNRVELSNDSIFLYAKQLYYWNTALPSYDVFLPRQYKSAGTELENYQQNLFNLVKASNSADFVSGSSRPKYSFIEDIQDRNPEAIAALPNAKAAVDLEGNGNDIGIYATSAVTADNITYKLYILAIDKNSPADLAGLTRGAYITSINNKSIGDAQQFTAESKLIDDAIYGDPSSVNFTGFKTDGTPFTVTLRKTVYKSNPIYKTNVLTVGGKKIGYVAYARFSNEANSITALNSVFDDFASAGVTDLVVDLRYNGGGYVNTAEHLVNLIAPATATGVMYREYYNSTMQNGKATILKNQPLLDGNDQIRYLNGDKKQRMLNNFDDISYAVKDNTHSFEKTGNVKNVTNVVFLVSRYTASASELVINSLKPKMNVKLVGEKTYGKPVGFFPVRIQNRYDVYMSLFETKNSLDEGGYFSGMVPDVAVNNDYGNYDFGNPSDGYLAKALNLLAPQANALSVVSRNKVMSVSADAGNLLSKKTIGDLNHNTEFVGMIENRRKTK